MVELTLSCPVWELVLLLGAKPSFLESVSFFFCFAFGSESFFFGTVFFFSLVEDRCSRSPTSRRSRRLKHIKRTREKGIMGEWGVETGYIGPYFLVFFKK